MDQQDDDFAALFEASMEGDSPGPGAKLRSGQTVTGRVVAITDETVFVDIGTRLEAQLERTQLGDKQVAVGDNLRATVANPGGRNAPILKMSLGGNSNTNADELREAAHNGTPVEGEFTKTIKGGLEVVLGGVRAFCPASQVDLGYTAELDVFVGQRHFFRVLEVRDNGRSVVVSRKALLEQERRQKAEELAGNLQVGAELDGIVQALQPYGAFVDIGGIAGLVHVSEISHSRVSAPSDVLSVGEKVRVSVLSIDPAASGKAHETRISLSMKALTQPEAGAKTEATAEVITATVTKTDHHGLAVETPSGPGFIPVAELNLARGSDPRRAHNVGDTLEVIVKSKDAQGKLRLSAKGVAEAEARKAFNAFRKGKGKSRSLGSLGDLLQAKIDLNNVPAGPPPSTSPPHRPAAAPQAPAAAPESKPVVDKQRPPRPAGKRKGKRRIV